VVDKAAGVTTERLAVYTRDMEKQRESSVLTQKTFLKRFPAVWHEAQILAIDTSPRVSKERGEGAGRVSEVKSNASAIERCIDG
jgi:hypothetical protein